MSFPITTLFVKNSRRISDSPKLLPCVIGRRLARYGNHTYSIQSLYSVLSMSWGEIAINIKSYVHAIKNPKKLIVPNPHTIACLSGKAYKANNQANNIGIDTILQTKMTGKRSQYITKKTNKRTISQSQTKATFSVAALGIAALILSASKSSAGNDRFAFGNFRTLLMSSHYHFISYN